MGENFRIRRATPGDLGRVAGIERETFGDPWSEEALEGCMGDIFLVADDAGSPVGYGIARLAGDQAEVINMAVDLEHRRRGIGRRLVDALLSEVERAGAAECFLDVRASNRAAIGLYRAVGFREVGERPRFYSKPVETAIVMHRIKTETGPGRR